MSIAPEKPNKFPINRRFSELCRALEIEPKPEANATLPAEGTLEYYKLQHFYLLALLQNRYVLEGNVVRLKILPTQGPGHALTRELGSDGGFRGRLSKENAEKAVRQLLGFVHCPASGTGWSALPRDAKHEREPGKPEPTNGWFHQDAYGVVPARVRERIYELAIGAPNELERYVERAIAFLEREAADPLGAPPWNEPFEFESGHEFILLFLNRVSRASSDIMIAAVNGYITASIGRQVFLSALRKGINVRFLVFDFIHGEVEQVARMIGRSQDSLKVFGTDTMEALLWLRARAIEENTKGKLELRLLKEDPKGRWYLIDALKYSPSSTAFVVPRAAGTECKTETARGERVSELEMERHSREVEALWARAQPVADEWLRAFEVWKADHEVQRILGQR
ncbi:MAG: hypothetical protein ABIQ16_12050 [Polyangiaceae bacterium]